MKRFTVVTIGTVMVLAGALHPQDAVETKNREANIKTYITLLRQDIKKGKVAVLTEMMELTPEEASKFWPVYNEYDKELTRMADERLALIRVYAENHGSMTDQQVTEMGRKVLDLESRRTELKKRYFDRLSQALTPKIAGRFLQIENQLLMILDLQVASSLPIVE
jgi:hypothetical protein